MLLAIIPARSGSRGIPKKNLVQLGSVPLIAHSIYAARQSNKTDKVVVSTDSSEIGDVATQWGAQVIDRPSEISGPDSPTESALIHAIDFLSSTGYIPSHCVLLQPTSPFRNPDSIDNGISTLLDNNFDSLLSAEPSHISLWNIGESTAEPQYDFKKRIMRQDSIGHQYRENGSIYAFSTDLLKQTNNRLGGRIGIHKSTQLESLEIDTAFDLWMCRQGIHNNIWKHPLPHI